MANKLYEESSIQAIADSIRGKTGKTDTMTVSQMAGEIDGITTESEPVLQDKTITENGSYTADEGYDGLGTVTVDVEQGLPEGTLNGLENGWDVMFYDENNEGLAFYSIKQGHTINPPVYTCKNWQTADGANQVFPFTPTADIIFYANNDTYASQLYEFYGIDSAVYPYLCILSQVNWSTAIEFTKQPLYFDGDVLVTTGSGYSGSSKSGYISSTTDAIDTFIGDIMNKITKVSKVSSGGRTGLAKTAYVFINHDIDISGTTLVASVQRLDE